MNFPDHKCGLYLTHNEHKDNYQSLDEYIQDHIDFLEDAFVSLEAIQDCVDKNELWVLQWYPDTPIGSYIIAGSSLEEVLKRANT